MTEEEEGARPAPIAQRIRVVGCVQGVWFRDSTRLRAEELGVAGWIRNRPDGSVEAFLEGAENAVEQLIAYCRCGPPHAKVERVEREPAAATGIRGFRIR